MNRTIVHDPFHRSPAINKDRGLDLKKPRQGFDLLVAEHSFAGEDSEIVESASPVPAATSCCVF
jgi:hypothetical protein